MIFTGRTGVDLVIGQPDNNFFQALLAPINIGICFDLGPVYRVFIFFKIIGISRGGFYFFNDGAIRFGINAVDTAANIYVKGGEKILADLGMQDFQILIDFTVKTTMTLNLLSGVYTPCFMSKSRPEMPGNSQ